MATDIASARRTEPGESPDRETRRGSLDDPAVVFRPKA
jgi:hypothetical protein